MERRQVLKTMLLSAGAIGTAFLAKEAVNFIDDAMRPQYVVRGAAPFETEPLPEWNRPTNWKRKIGDAELRIHIIDGRKP